MKKILIVLIIASLLAIIGLLLRQNSLQDKIKTLSKTIEIREQQLRASEKAKQALIDEYNQEKVTIHNKNTGEVKTITKDQLGKYGLLGDEDTFSMCRYSREVIAQKALQERATLKDIEDIVAVYDLTCKGSE